MEQIKIKSIKKLDKKNDRYDLTINSTNNFFANGILIHNTSQRTGNVLVEKPIPKWKTLISKIIGIKPSIKSTKNYQTWIGTRRVVLGERGKGTGFHPDELRVKAAEPFLNNLHKGETVFYEILGYELNEKPIMGTVSNRKFGDKKFEKEFIKRYGEQTTYSYGCKVGEMRIQVYRITMTNEDGVTIDLPWNDVVKRCSELGVEPVTLLDTFYYEKERDDEKLIKRVNELVEGASTLDPKHIREGVCIRSDNSLLDVFVVKHKSETFKILESIVKDNKDYVDKEESS